MGTSEGPVSEHFVVGSGKESGPVVEGQGEREEGLGIEGGVTGAMGWKDRQV